MESLDHHSWPSQLPEWSQCPPASDGVQPELLLLIQSTACFGPALLVLDSLHLDFPPSTRSMAYIGFLTSLWSAGRMGLSSSVSDLVYIGFAFLLQSPARLDLPFPVLSSSRLGFPSPILDLVHVGSVASAHSMAHLGFGMLVSDFLHSASTSSIRSLSQSDFVVLVLDFLNPEPSVSLQGYCWPGPFAFASGFVHTRILSVSAKLCQAGLTRFCIGLFET